MSEDKIQSTKEAMYKFSQVGTLSDIEQTILRNGANAIEQLQQENQRLKQWDKNKDSRNSRQRVANAKLIKENEELKEKEKFKSCGFSASIKELYRLATVLDEFEKWLEEGKTLPNWEYGDMYFGEFCDKALDKLQELKEGKK